MSAHWASTACRSTSGPACRQIRRHGASSRGRRSSTARRSCRRTRSRSTPTIARTGCGPSCSSPWTMSATRAAARSRRSRTTGWAPSCARCPPKAAPVAIRASVEGLPEPGHAILRISDLDAAPEGLAISIQRQQGPDSHLADDGWRRTEAWLLPERVERKRDVMEFHLGPEICDRLAGIATVRLRVKEPDIGVVATTVIAWPSMLTSGATDPSSRLHDDTVRLRRAAAPPPPPPPTEAAPAPEPELPPPMPPPRPELRASRALDGGPPRRSGPAAPPIAAIVLVARAGRGSSPHIPYFQPQAEPAPP